MSVQTEVKKPDGAPAPQPAAAPAKKHTELQVRQQSIKDLIETAKPKFAAVIPKHIDVDRLVRVTIACINKTPALLNCTKESLLNAIMTAAQLGVEPTGVLGSAYLVPYGQECTLIVGYRGLIDLARRSGQIESIEAHVVHENDRFTLKYGLEPVLEHEPAWAGDPGNVKAVYAIAKLKDGGKQIEVMTRSQVDKIRDASRAKGGPWKDHYEEMARKTVVRRIAKYLPLTPELADALALDEGDQLEQEEIAVPKGTAGLKDIVKAKQAQVEVKAEPTTVPHDPVTGEVRETGADDGEGPPDGPTETDPSLG